MPADCCVYGCRHYRSWGRSGRRFPNLQAIDRYCTPVWSPCYQKDKLLIERVQHWFTRMIPGFSKLTYCERLERLGLWSLEERRNRADIIEVFKMAKGWSAIPLESMFELSTVKHLRGHKFKLVSTQVTWKWDATFSPKDINNHWMWTR